MARFCLFPVVLLLFIINSFAQDRIYFTKNKVEDRVITQIEPAFLKAVDAKNPEIAYSITPATVLFSFNSKGNYIVLPQLYKDEAKAKKYITNFLNPSYGAFYTYDKIITTKNHIIICQNVSESDNKIIYTVDGNQKQIPVADVAVIIFKDGNHVLKTGIEKAYKILSAVEELYVDLSTRQPEDKNENTSKEGNTKQTGKDSAVVSSKVDVTGEVLKPDSATLMRLQQKALINIKQLGDYIKMISMNETEPEEVLRTIDQALTLFVPDATIEVSSVNNNNIFHYPIREYLNRLGALKYDKVVIEWYKIMYATSFRKGPDGNYYATINFEQRFAGTLQEKTVYQDITRKSVEIILKTYERSSGGVTTIEWDVFLGDISVTVTKPA